MKKIYRREAKVCISVCKTASSCKRKHCPQWKKLHHFEIADDGVCNSFSPVTTTYLPKAPDEDVAESACRTSTCPLPFHVHQRKNQRRHLSQKMKPLERVTGTEASQGTVGESLSRRVHGLQGYICETCQKCYQHSSRKHYSWRKSIVLCLRL